MPSTSKAITSTSASIPFQNISPIPSPESDGSSQHYSSSPSGPVSASTSFSSSSDQEKLAISGWENAASNANVDSTAPKPQDWNVDNALDTMRSSTYPLHQLDMVNEAGSALESLKEVANTSFPTVKATKESSRSTEIFHPDERDCVIMINRREAGAKDLRFPDLFRYGVRFTPDSNESNVYRTIRISGLPSDITMMKLLEKVRGGMVLDAKLLDTMSITGDMTGLVTFLHEHAAMAYEEHAGKNVISFNGLSAKITLVRTPTWPISIKLRKAINDFGHTRCFKVHHFPRVIKPVALKMELAVCSVVDINGVESMSMSKDDVLGLRFSSILFAGQASALFSCTPRYEGCVVQWIPDPCAQSLETLIENGNKELEVVKETSPVALIESVPEPTTFGEAGRLTQIHCDSAPEASDVLKVMTPMPSFELDPELDALISPVGLHQWSGRPSRKSLVDRGWRWRWRNDGC